MEDSQKGFVEDNLFSLAECYLYKEFIPKAIYDDEEVIGFVLYYFVEGDRVESAPGRIERESKDINRTYEITRRRYY